MKTTCMSFSSLATAVMLALYSSAATASDLAIFNGSSKFVYGGCFTETQGLNGSHSRTLKDTTEVGPNNMTVPVCLEFCDKYKYAGLQWSRECWCGNEINMRSTKQNDSDCDLACSGDQHVACGGNLKLSIYNSTTTSSASMTFNSPTLRPTATSTTRENAAALAVTAIWAVMFARGMALSLCAL
ncbi:WSC domain-containing protein [Apiospora arundinis]|uniref:WSC domain-containing protein n=1 Tax=Apiospora arundinis TaxID=335852 RepID=A0ABR2J8T5_9PEZI